MYIVLLSKKPKINVVTFVEVRCLNVCVVKHDEVFTLLFYFFFIFFSVLADPLLPHSLRPLTTPPPSPHHETVTIARSKDSLNEYWRNKTKMVIMIDWMSSILLRRHDTLSLSNMNVCISQGRRDSDIDLRKVR